MIYIIMDDDSCYASVCRGVECVMFAFSINISLNLFQSIKSLLNVFVNYCNLLKFDTVDSFIVATLNCCSISFFFFTNVNAQSFELLLN